MVPLRLTALSVERRLHGSPPTGALLAPLSAWSILALGSGEAAFRTHVAGLLSDPDRRAHDAYGAWGERPGRGEGVIRSTFLVDERGKVKKAWYGVKPDGHAQEVLAELKS